MNAEAKMHTEECVNHRSRGFATCICPPPAPQAETDTTGEYPDVLHPDRPARIEWWWTEEGRADWLAKVKADARRDALLEAAESMTPEEWGRACALGDYHDPISSAVRTWLRDRAGQET